MNPRPTCAVCGRGVAPDSDHVKVEAEAVKMRDRNDVDTYYLHDRCARRVIGGWRKP
ncbi:MAG: hypothetical protein ABEJ68_07640 [Halobacteriaceae archaeon]